jgi:hypothetical protein
MLLLGIFRCSIYLEVEGPNRMRASVTAIRVKAFEHCLDVGNCFYGLAVSNGRYLTYQLTHGSDTQNSFPKAVEKV